MGDIYEKLNLTVLDFLSCYQKLNRMALSRTGLTISQMTILRYLHTKGPSRITAIAADLGMDAGNVSNICSRLEKSGYINREFPAKDKRLCLVYIPENSLAILEPRFQSSQPLYDYTKEVLSPEKAEQAAESLEALVEYYKKMASQLKDFGGKDDTL